LLREHDLAVAYDVELALRTLSDARVEALAVQLGRETRGPFVVAASDGAIEDLDAHEKTLQPRATVTAMSSKVAALLALAAVLATSAAAKGASTGAIVFAADRAPVAWGEIYRVDANGARVDLSRSFASDVAPTLSPDGKLVAFQSNRGGHVALYAVGIGGAHLHRISPLFQTAEGVSYGGEIAWSPDGKRLFADLRPVGTSPLGGDALWVGDLAGRGKVVGRSSVQHPTWSPDGTRLAYEPVGGTRGAEVDVVTAANTLRWSAPASSVPGWGRGGRLAVIYHGTTSVYDETGHRLDAWIAGNAVWSPDGTELASLTAGRLEVRRGGVGRPFVDARVAKGSVDWLGNDRVRITTGTGYVGYDVAHRRALALPPTFSTFGLYPAVFSRDGTKIAGLTAHKDFSATLHIDTLGGNVGRTLASGPPCSEQPWFQDVQFTPDGRSLVYQTGCAEPNADIYAIGADGKGLVQLTKTGSHEIEPAWSPDGSKIAYARAITANKCDGCDTTVWVMNADGSNPHAITTDADPWHDQQPTWSPDGTELAFYRWTYDAASLAVIPATGGSMKTIAKNGTDPKWGPTGIAFVNGGTLPTKIQVVQPDGTGTQTLAGDDGVLLNGLAVSRAGTVAYLRTVQAGRLQLVAGKATPVLLGGLHSVPSGSALAWSPDGTRLAFDAQDAVGVSDVWIVDRDGTHLTRLTHGVGAVEGLSWR
jgi:Tol biopolymer transport system component